ncbi:MAG: hypothetical protein ACKV2Q_24110 [Planctomycetaceae bacterium]
MDEKHQVQLNRDIIETIRSAAKKLTGFKRREFLAEIALQYCNGNRGKIENCVNHVAFSYSAPGFDTLVDARLSLPEEWANDPARRKKRTSRTMSRFPPTFACGC